MKKKIFTVKNKIYFTIFFCLLILPIIINYIFSTPAILPILELVNEYNYQTWVGYYGAIISGAITLFGVYWTLDYQKKSEKITNRINVQPVLKASLSKDCDTESTIENAAENSIAFIPSMKELETSRNNFFVLSLFPNYLNFKNVGRGELYKLTLVEHKPFYEAGQKLNICINYNENIFDQFLLKDEMITIPIVNAIIPGEYDFVINELISMKRLDLSFDGLLVFQYEDSYENKYTQEILYDFTYNVQITNDETTLIVEKVSFKNNPPKLIS